MESIFCLCVLSCGIRLFECIEKTKIYLLTINANGCAPTFIPFPPINADSSGGIGCWYWVVKFIFPMRNIAKIFDAIVKAVSIYVIYLA